MPGFSGIPEMPQGRKPKNKKPNLKKENQRLKKMVRHLQNLLLEAKELIMKLKSPPNGYAIFFRPHPDGQPNEVDILFNGHLTKVLLVVEGVKVSDLKPGWEVVLGGAHGGAIIGVTKKYWQWGDE